MADFLYCSDPLRPGRVDPVFSEEAWSAASAGAGVALLDHDALAAGDAEGALRRVPRGSGPYWYRGWMMPPGTYAALGGGLAERGCRLLTDAAAYRRAHELPGWYEAFEGLTPRSVWRPCAPGAPPDRRDLVALVSPLGPGAAVVKDYVKSRKHEWTEACYVSSLADATSLSRVVARMFALQDEALTGGLVVRCHEPFTPGGEARVWWVDGDPVLTTAHPDTPDDLPAPELDAVAAAVRGLACRFVTTDLALRRDGRWRVVEVGDGQVSGLPPSADASALFAALAAGPAGPH
ncbi:ATP-grasp domain-containing protein [Streptomyces sp. NBC_01497]|uniref:ATP-grasp domain-containing protein n=1 Tax=Streptomyces sp. NBC_01497 TaxID=2903885 RepID=UPI002E342400|nr:ATP-grasp domain-containing protein [Streptomyces sp. NBC_01497]